MSITYDKPFKTYDEQLKIMVGRQVSVPDVSQGRRYLANYSYYTLMNGYKGTVLSIPNSDNFIQGTTIDLLCSLHTTDTALQSILLKYILYVERSLKSHMSYLISEQYGVFTDYNDLVSMNPDDYLCKLHYGNSIKKNNTIRAFKNLLGGTYGFQNTSVRHYLSHHNHIPPWILITSLTLGDVIRWYDILCPSDKETISSDFIDNKLSVEQRKEFFKKSLDLLREYRNGIAHGNRTLSSLASIRLPSASTCFLSKGIILHKEYNANQHNQCGLPAVIVALLTLLNIQSLQNSFCEELLDVIHQFAHFDVSFAGTDAFSLFNLPKDFENRVNKYFKC